MHPTVCFYKVGEVQMRHSMVFLSMVFLSDDICHDYHAMHHFTLASIEALAKAVPLVQRVYIFSDGCAGQYKGKAFIQVICCVQQMLGLHYFYFIAWCLMKEIQALLEALISCIHFFGCFSSSKEREFSGCFFWLGVWKRGGRRGNGCDQQGSGSSCLLRQANCQKCRGPAHLVQQGTNKYRTVLIEGLLPCTKGGDNQRSSSDWCCHHPWDKTRTSGSEGLWLYYPHQDVSLFLRGLQEGQWFMPKSGICWHVHCA